MHGEIGEIGEIGEKRERESVLVGDICYPISAGLDCYSIFSPVFYQDFSFIFSQGVAISDKVYKPCLPKDLNKTLGELDGDGASFSFSFSFDKMMMGVAG